MPYRLSDLVVFRSYMYIANTSTCRAIMVLRIRGSSKAMWENLRSP
jgi:hypothetical protein